MNKDFLCPVCKCAPLITDYCPSCSRIEGAAPLLDFGTVTLGNTTYRTMGGYLMGEVAPLPDDVAKMVERLRSVGNNTRRDAAFDAADLIERLARQVPPDCVVVPRELIEAAKNLMTVKSRHHTELAYKQLLQSLIAAAGVK